MGLSQGCAAGVFALLGGWFAPDEARALGAFVGMSGWLPFERQLREILQCDDIPASAGYRHQDVQSDDSPEMAEDSHDKANSDDDSEIGDEETARQDSSSDQEVHADADADAFSELDFDDDPFKQSGALHDEFDPFANDEEEVPLLVQAINHIREIVDIPMASTSQQSLDDSHSQEGFHHLQSPVFLGHGCEDPKLSVNLGRKMSHVLSTGFGMDVTWKAYEGLGHWYRVKDEIEDILCFLQDRVKLPVEPVLLSHS